MSTETQVALHFDYSRRLFISPIDRHEIHIRPSESLNPPPSGADGVDASIMLHPAASAVLIANPRR